MANEQNLKPRELTTEEATIMGRKGGIASGKVRREKASLKKGLEDILNSDIRITKGAIYDMYKANGIDISNKSLVELANLGLLFGAVNGNASNYKTMLETNSEIDTESNGTTPTIKIEINDNSNLEKVLYEENRHNENDK